MLNNSYLSELSVKLFQIGFIFHLDQTSISKTFP